MNYIYYESGHKYVPTMTVVGEGNANDGGKIFRVLKDRILIWKNEVKDLVMAIGKIEGKYSWLN